MFLDELADLKDRYPARFALHHVLTRERRPAPTCSPAASTHDAARAASSTRSIGPETVDEWFLCGPFELVQLCRRHPRRLGCRGVRDPLRAVHHGRRRPRGPVAAARSRSRRRRAGAHASRSASTARAATVTSPVLGERVDPQRRAAGARRRAVRVRGRRLRHLPRGAASRARSRWRRTTRSSPTSSSAATSSPASRIRPATVSSVDYDA